MYFNLQNFTLPDFGLMTKTDKLKLDGIDTSTLLTKTEASETYATKAEMRQYIRQVLESDTGFVFLNGNSSEVGLIPAFSKPSPELSLSPTSVSIGGTKTTATVNVSRLGNGAITATLPSEASGKITATVEGTVITVGYVDGSDTYNVTVAVAETDNYAAATATLLVMTSNSGSAPIPE